MTIGWKRLSVHFQTLFVHFQTSFYPSQIDREGILPSQIDRMTTVADWSNDTLIESAFVYENFEDFGDE